MQDPDPDGRAQSGWKPTTSTVAGALVGTAVAQLVAAGIETLSHAALSSATGGAITTVCIFVVGYLFPDGGRK